MTRFQNVLRLSLYLPLETFSQPLQSTWRIICNQRAVPISASYRGQINRLSFSSQCYDDDDGKPKLSSNDPTCTKEQSENTADDPVSERQEILNESSSSTTESRSPLNTVSSMSHYEEEIPNPTHPDSSSALRVVKVVPGKGAPPAPPTTCCGTGCANCVWIEYAEELREYYKDGGEQAKKAIEQIEDPSLKMFIKLELGLL